MKRILFMHQASSIGGGSYCLLNVVKAVDKTLFEPVVALKSEGPLAEELRKQGFEVIIFPEMAAIPYNRGLMQWRSLRAYWAVERSKKGLKQLLTDKMIDIVYLNNMMLCRYLQPAKECGCQTVVHVREHWPLDEHRRQLEWARACVYGYADKMIAINQYSASIFPEKEASIVYDWIDMDCRYKPMPLNEIFGEDMAGKKVLLYTGGASYIKGPDYIVKSFTQFVKGDEYRLLMLGCKNFLNGGLKHRIKLFLSHFGYHYWGKEVQEMAESDARVCRIEAVYELSDIIRQSTCFISYFTIPHANLALAENIVLGNACIAADTEEAREYSGDGRYACLVSPMNDEEVFAEALITFLRDVDLWTERAKEGAEEIKAMFAPVKNAETLNQVLRMLVE